MTSDILVTVNGERRKVVDAHPGESFAYVLRDRLGLTGAKGACEEGEWFVFSSSRCNLKAPAWCLTAATQLDCDR